MGTHSEILFVVCLQVVVVVDVGVAQIFVQYSADNRTVRWESSCGRQMGPFTNHFIDMQYSTLFSFNQALVDVLGGFYQNRKNHLNTQLI